MIRVLTLPDRQDKFLVRMGDEVSIDVPENGRVTLALNGGWSESGIAYCHMTFKPIRQGLLSFARRRA
jgi:hypothetical protein